MKTQTLFRLGALAIILTAVGLTTGNLIYFFGSVENVFYCWFAYAVFSLWIFAYFSLFAVQAKRINIFLLIGFILLVIGKIFDIVQNTVELGAISGAVSNTLLGPLGSFIAVNFIAFWTFPIGSILFGFGTIRAGIFPRWLGILMMVLGVTAIFFWDSAFFIVAIIQSVLWGAFGWASWNFKPELDQ
jgi:hypothetical protein